MIFLVFDDTKVHIAKVIVSIDLNFCTKMNYELSCIDFETHLYNLLPDLKHVPNLILNPYPSIQNSRFSSLWNFATKCQMKWNLLLDDQLTSNDKILYDLFESLFHCCRFVYINIQHEDLSDYVLGMTFILPFFCIMRLTNFCSVTEGFVYRQICYNGIKDCIIECYNSLLRETVDINDIMYQVFGTESHSKHETILRIVSHVRTIVPRRYRSIESMQYADDDNNYPQISKIVWSPNVLNTLPLDPDSN